MASNLAGRALEPAGRASDTSGRASEWARILKPARGSPAPFEVLAAPWSPPSSLRASSRLSYSSFKILLCHLSWSLRNSWKPSYLTGRMKLVEQRDLLAIQYYVDCSIWKLSGWSKFDMCSMWWTRLMCIVFRMHHWPTWPCSFLHKHFGGEWQL